MRKQLKIDIENIDLFKKQIILFGNQINEFAFLDSSGFDKKNTNHSNYEYNFLAAFGSVKQITGDNHDDFSKFNQFVNESNDWLFGFLTYDLKNELENLESKNTDDLNLPGLHFFIPEFVLDCKDATITAHYLPELHSEQEVIQKIHTIQNVALSKNLNKGLNLNLNSRFSKPEYMNAVQKLKQHIQRGDIYEVNFCQEFYSHSAIDPVSVYLKLREISPTPFSCYYKLNDKYLISASPERFLKKTGSKIISQPIKGTQRRSTDKIKDEKLKTELLNDPKERAENVMIVDLVRNDLSRTAKKGTVKVDELFGIYTFKQVHQMISTISAEISENTNVVDVIKKAFPMGSMTGAPKIRAMELIDHYEKSKRGLYSGSVGFITPEKDFDFNVVIRSILYNEAKKYVSFTVGGAITSLSVPEKEYEECLVKAKAIMEVLN